MKIIPMRDLKNTVDVEKLCVEENGPIFVIQNNNPKLVVMDIEYYEKTMRKIYEAKTILSGLDDLKKGKIKDGETVISNIRSKYSI